MFSSVSAFDLHRIGSFQRKARRCMTEQEMRAKGMVQNEKGWWMRSAFERKLPWTAASKQELEAVS